ncbi:MAG: FprA family A-type flavoprotein [Desulfurococcales archaeon]|nr:FprA family A-type flavoprotein [Desulfurococcales archaeon]
MSTIHVREVASNLYLLRKDDGVTKFFEGIWEIPEGITYNAYLLLTDEGVALIDGWKKEFSGEFISTIRELVDPKDIKLVVVNHAEPDHTGSLPAILKEANDPLVVGHPMAKNLISTLQGVTPTFKPLKDGERLSFGDETLRFVFTPWLHWPETIVTYLERRSVLLSCDVFGGYSIPQGVFDDEVGNVEEYMQYVRKYMVNVIGHYRDFVIKGLTKVESAGIKPAVIAPGHGLLWRRDVGRIVEEYKRWDREVVSEGKVTVVYTSMYGYVEAAIKEVVSALKEAGLKVVVHGFTDKARANLSDVLSDLDDSEAVVFGTATYEAGIFPLMRYVMMLLKEKMKGGKPAMVVTTYGWGDIAGRGVKAELEGTGFEVVSAVSVHGTLDPKTLEALRDGVKALVARLGKA